MTVGIAEMCRPQLARPVPADHPRRNFEGDASSQHFGMGGPDVIDLDHEFGQRFTLRDFIYVVEHQLCPATIEKHKWTCVHCNFEPDLL